MLEAVHRFSRERILPGDAVSGGGRYLCGCCEAPVVLVQAFTLHFRHEKYRARPDCENYVWSEYRYTGRPTRQSAAREIDPDDLSYLGFEMAVDGPRLSVFLPATNGATTGHIELVERTVRRIPLAEVGRGLRISFPLSQATWAIRTSNDVSEEYLLQLTLGRQYLELERNLFFASDAVGRQIRERTTLMLGESLWWIGRTDIRSSGPIPRRVDVELGSVDNGWFVFLVHLPERCELEECAEISRWLQRRIQPRRARVWVDTPFPRARRQDGVYVYAANDGLIRCAADQSVTFQVIDSAGAVVLEAENATTLQLPASIVGDLVIYSDGVRALRIERRLSSPSAASSVLFRAKTEDWSPFTALQKQIDIATAAGATSLRVDVRWSPPQLSSLLRTTARPLSKTAIEFEGVLTCGSGIDFDKLGSAIWPAVKADPADVAPPSSEQLPTPALFAWLSSVGSDGANRGGGLYLRRASMFQQRFPILKRIAQQSWPIEFSAQVRQAERVLGSLR